MTCLRPWLNHQKRPFPTSTRPARRAYQLCLLANGRVDGAPVAQYKGRPKTRNFSHSSPIREEVNTADTSRDQQQHSTDRPRCPAWTERPAAYWTFLQPRHGSTLRRSTGRTFALDSGSLIHQESQTITAYLPYCKTKTTIIIIYVGTVDLFRIL
jgi:hypothetical protein